MKESNEQFKNKYEEYNEAMYNFARKLTKDHVEAEELVQISAVKAFRGWNTFRQGSNFKAWIFTIIKNCFITKYNKRQKRNVVSIPVEEMQFATNNRHKIDNGALMTMRLKELMQSFNYLSYKLRIPFEMFIEGYKYNEISSKLNIPIGTVKSRINSARVKMQKRLNGMESLAA